MKARLYARVSKERQGAFSIETQLQKCRKKADELGIADSETYIDNGFTVDVDRPGFNRMIADYQDGDIIIALSSDRLCGSFSQTMDFRSQYKLQLVLTEDDELRPTNNIVHAYAATEPTTASAASKQSNEVRQKFLAHIAGLIDFWDQEPKSSRAKLQGLAVSILSVFDGWAGDLPGFIFDPEPDKENCSENTPDSAGSLHDK
ncbi:recombinase family protein [Sporomusa termitida]|uniref:Resolvase/invertase-type recombinase catalytic domain-containing protein n=1 Tax=Sporomusa termitida TaxID=2377 RepID=A0A517DSY3_9FIRM|nr:recombinase family protein [Sporomusa termitida]QDR80465.1 hypothetical protein SPTER_17920 [Sporomusa termitida]